MLNHVSKRGQWDTRPLGHMQTKLQQGSIKFDGWPRKTILHLFYATLTFLHHFVAIGEFKLELPTWNAKFGSNLMIF